MKNFIRLVDNSSKNFSGKSPLDFVKFNTRTETVTNFTIDFAKLTDKDLYKYCKETGLNARIWNRRFIAAIPEVAKRRLYKRYGYCSIHEFAAKLAGVSHNNVDGVLRVDEKLKDMPKIKSLISEKGLNKVRLVSNIVKLETENFWAEKIKNMTKSSLELFIKEKFHPGTEDSRKSENAQRQGQIGIFDLETFRSQDENGSTDEIHEFKKKTFTIQIDSETEFELRKFKQKIEKEKKEPVDWNTALKELVKRINFRTSHESKLANRRPARKSDTAHVSRHIPAEKKRELEQKHYGQCAYHDCNKPAEQIHHINRFAIYRNHKNIIPLCKAHHDFMHQNSSIALDRKFNNFKREGLPAASG
jgi:hypothetical protein